MQTRAAGENEMREIPSATQQQDIAARNNRHCRSGGRLKQESDDGKRLTCDWLYLLSKQNLPGFFDAKLTSLRLGFRSVSTRISGRSA